MMKGLYIHRSLVSFAVLCCSVTIYADTVDPITQGNSNADRIAASAQTNMTQQQQILAQRLQALSAAMQAQNPTAPIVVQPLPQVQKQPTPAAAAPAAPPPATSTQETNATGLKPSTQNNNSNSRSQWDYGF